MKKFIISILALCSITPIFAVSKADIIGTWKMDADTLKITAETIYWGCGYDVSDCFTYFIDGDMIVMDSEVNHIEVHATREGDTLIIKYPHLNELMYFKKIDLRQEKKGKMKFMVK